MRMGGAVTTASRFAACFFGATVAAVLAVLCCAAIVSGTKEKGVV